MPVSRGRRTRERAIRRRRRTALLALAIVSCLGGLFSGAVLSASADLDAGAACDPATSPPEVTSDSTQCGSSEDAPAPVEETEPAPAETPAAETPPATETPAAPEQQASTPEPAGPTPGDSAGATDSPAPSGDAPAAGDPAPAAAPRRRGTSRRAQPRRAERRAKRRQARRRAHRRAARERAARKHAKRARRPGTRFPRPALRHPLPDPLPAAKRLDAAFAHRLASTAEREGVSWSLVLAVLRARGGEGAVPASAAAVRAVARQLAALGATRDPGRAVHALGRRSSFTGPLAPGIVADGLFEQRVIALARYNRAVGLEGLVHGLRAVRKKIAERLLGSENVQIYPGGRADIAADRIDVRVLALLRYLALQHRKVTVTSLISGHGVFTTSGNVSAHVYGHAVDIAALEGLSILGHQQPGGVTERALRNILLLPEELQPKQLISLFELGGPSFAMADHGDHIHAGY